MLCIHAFIVAEVDTSNNHADTSSQQCKSKSLIEKWFNENQISSASSTVMNENNQQFVPKVQSNSSRKRKSLSHIQYYFDVNGSSDPPSMNDENDEVNFEADFAFEREPVPKRKRSSTSQIKKSKLTGYVAVASSLVSFGHSPCCQNHCYLQFTPQQVFLHMLTV